MNSQDCLPELPALRALGRLAELRPVVLIDTREQTPLEFSRLVARRATLTTGDYSFAGGESVFVVERKSVSDLVGCVTSERERFEKELARIRGFRFSRLLVIGTREEIERARYRSNVSPRAVVNSLHSWEARFVPVVFAATPPEAARLVERWVWWAARAIVEEANGLLRGSMNDESKEEAKKT